MDIGQYIGAPIAQQQNIPELTNLIVGAEKHQIEEELKKTGMGIPKWEGAVEKILYQTQNLHQLWVQSDYNNKQKLQYLVFPKGIAYNRKNDLCRSEEVNPVFSYLLYC